MPFRISTYDRESKPSSMTLEVDAGATTEELEALCAAVDGVILGSAVSGIRTTAETIEAGSAIPPTNDFAQAANKWLLRIQDSVNGKIFTHEIGTADNAVLASSTDDYVDLTGGVGLALKTAVEDVYESPYGNAGVLLSVQQVNRKG